MTEKPDPSEVEAVGDTEGVYDRDEQGELQPGSWHVIEYDGQYKRVRPYPLPTGELQKFQRMGEDVEMETICEILADKYETPDRTVEQWQDTDPAMFGSCVDLLVEIATGEKPSSAFHAEIQDELEKRDSEGN